MRFGPSNLRLIWLFLKQNQLLRRRLLADALRSVFKVGLIVGKLGHQR
jgi:hypothetical protein